MVQKRWEIRTILGKLLDNLHDADDAGLLAVGVVKEGLVADIHVAHVVAS